MDVNLLALRAWMSPGAAASACREECAERIRLIDEYGQRAIEFSRVLDVPKRFRQTAQVDWYFIENARVRLDKAWLALEQHISEHACEEFSLAPKAFGMAE